MQTSILPLLPTWEGPPDLVFVLIAFIAYRFAWIPGIWLVFSLGWLVDVVGSINLGFYPVICLITFATLKILTNKSPVKEVTYEIPLVGLSYFLVQMFFYFSYSITLPEMLPEWSWGQTIQRTTLVVVSAIPLFLLFNSLFENLRKRSTRIRRPRRRTR